MGTAQDAGRSRRSLLAGGAAGALALLAGAIGRPAAVRAGSDGDVVLGSSNNVTTTTTKISTGPLDAFWGSADGGTGVVGLSNLGDGVYGHSNSGDSGHFNGDLGRAVYASSFSTTKPSVEAYSWGDHTAVAGVSGLISKAIAPSTGVYGYAESDLIGRSPIGVHGEAPVGVGVKATSSTGTGLAASSLSGQAVAGTSGTGIGVRGMSTSGYGLFGMSTNQSGAYLVSNAAAAPAAVARSQKGQAGLAGYSDAGVGSVPAAPAKVGVYGRCALDATSHGVHGSSVAGTGVYGHATSGWAVAGYVSTGTALYGKTDTLKSGTALHTVGRVRLDNSAGIATIAKAASSVVVTPGIDLTATSAVVATLQGGAGGATSVRCVVVNATSDTFTIYLTAAATVAVKVAWHVFG